MLLKRRIDTSDTFLFQTDLDKNIKLIDLVEEENENKIEEITNNNEGVVWQSLNW